MSRGAMIMSQLLQASADEELGGLANELLGELFRNEYAVGNLVPLLRSDNIELIKVGAWLLSELAAKGRDLRSELPQLLQHPDVFVKTYAIEAALLACNASDAATIADVIRLLKDPSRPVRLVAVDFVFRARESSLDAAMRALELNGNPVDDDLVSSLLWLLGDGSNDPAAVESMINSGSPVERKFGFVAASGLEVSHPQLLSTAARSSDPDIAELARDEIENAKHRWHGVRP